ALFPRCEDRPSHVPADRVLDYDVFVVDAPDGDFAGAMARLPAAGAPDLFWTPANRGHWVATDAALIETILCDPARFSSRAMRVPKDSNPVPPILPLMLDPPQHLKYRILLMGAMSPAAIRRMTPEVRALSIGIIEALKPAGGCEFVRDFAQQMPIAIFLSMLGLPLSDRPEIMAIVDRIIRPDVPETRMHGFADLGRYTMARVAERRANPGDDLISQLVAARIDGEPLDDETLQGLMSVLMLAGLDTVAGMLGFIAAFLARNPAHRRRLIDEQALIPAAIEEFLRRMAMVNLTREVAVDCTLAGVAMKVGELVVVPTALANLDEDRFADPLAVDFDRRRPRHATFGAGPHVCMGAMLARTEIAIFLEEWLKRIPDFTIDPAARLEVRVGAAAMIPALPLIWPVPSNGETG
ncbi:cytochrome P450, partial [Sphingomonas solaris]